MQAGKSIQTSHINWQYITQEGIFPYDINILSCFHYKMMNTMWWWWHHFILCWNEDAFYRGNFAHSKKALSCYFVINIKRKIIYHNYSKMILHYIDLYLSFYTWAYFVQLLGQITIFHIEYTWNMSIQILYLR